MSFGLFISLLLLNAVFFCDARCAVQNHEIITHSRNPFEGGAVGSCEIPTTNFCSGIIDYAVPTSIAKLATIIENGLRSEIAPLEDLGESQSCINAINAYKALRCRQKFPRCHQQEGSDKTFITINRHNCSAMEVVNQCSSPEVTGLCEGAQNNITISNGECRPISELKGESNSSFKFCSINDTTLMTEWMFEYIKFLDQELKGTLVTHPSCGPGFISHMCNSIGRCTSDGEKIEFINSHESCNNAVTCYTDELQRTVEDVASCTSWPQEYLRNCLPAANTVATSSTTSETSGKGLVTPGSNLEFVLNSSPLLMGQHEVLGICLLITVFMTIFR